MTNPLFRSWTCAAALSLFVVILTSCEMTGGGSAVSRGPAYDNAIKNLTSEIEGVSVKAQWVKATRSESHDPLLEKNMGRTFRQPYISDQISNTQCYYSNSRVTPDGVFHVHQTNTNLAETNGYAGGEYEISLRKVSQVKVHNHEFSVEFSAVCESDANKVMGMVSDAPTQTLDHNMTGTWTVELVQGAGKKMTDYNFLYFPNRSKAEAFASAWRSLAGMLK